MAVLGTRVALDHFFFCVVRAVSHLSCYILPSVFMHIAIISHKISFVGDGKLYFELVVIYFEWSDVLSCIYCLVCFYRSGVPDYNIHTYI